VKKKVLVLGGSYFVGRVFCMLASQRDDMNLFVVNRGRYTLDKPHITEYQCERHDIKKLLEILPPLKFDAVVDFCAYEPLDIDLIIEALGERVEQYLYLSTSSVYDPEIPGVKTEDSALIKQAGDDAVSQYVIKKLLLEFELEKLCATQAINYTIIRPTFIYGPYNYAPRESYFIKMIVQKNPIPLPTDATAKFSFVYVADVARALLTCINNECSYGGAFNLAGSEKVDYPLLFAEFERCNGAPFATKPLTVEQALREAVPLPFPLIGDDLCDGRLFAETFDFSYTSFSEGMSKAFKAFKSVYE
jgi:nucleoside-diphosphate-sugar epimerase